MSFRQKDTALLKTFYRTAAINEKRHPYGCLFFIAVFIDSIIFIDPIVSRGSFIRKSFIEPDFIKHGFIEH